MNKFWIVYYINIVKNIGEAGSELNWEITDWPDWGTWNFNPANGNDLTPEEGDITVQVKVTAPDDPQQTFDGEVKIEKLEDGSDFDIITVSLKTPRSRTNNSPFINFLHNYPMIYQILLRVLNL